MHFDRLKWTQLKEMGDRTFLVPLGSIEQHGLHLPLSTDTTIVTEIARRIEERMSDQVVLLPTQWLGHSPHHLKFGCASVYIRTYMDMLGELCQSLVESGAKRIFLLNGHGGNEAPARAALREVKTKLSARADVYIAFVSYWALAAEAFRNIRESPRGGMGHACEMETSIMLALRPDEVDLAAARPAGPYDQASRYLVHDMLQGQPYTLVNEFDELSSTGAIGMPQYASAEKGERFLKAAVDAVCDLLSDFANWNYQSSEPGH